ncbi:MAG: choline kinase family protein [Rhizobiaceae bacterium]|nr:choline kinase family protein [Rhizobiaceae bacterium]|tara:strand:+ start:129353 stop:130276 length:924 start_codon:yes stop_codon:yes gene_type:complete
MSTELQKRLDAAVSAVPGWSPATVDVVPLDGGVTNTNFLATHDCKMHFLKVYGVGTESFINRDASVSAARQAHAMGIAPNVLHYDNEAGLEIVEFLEGYRASTNADFARKDFLDGVIDLYATFHKGQALAETKTVFEMTDEHIEQGKALNAIYPADFDWLIKQYGKAKQAFEASGLDIVPCHNDPMPGNFMVAMNGDEIKDMKLIDYEYASNNERAYELGVFLAEVFVDEATSLELIKRYFGEMRAEMVARVTVARAIADMKWGSWAVQQRQLQDWDFDYQKYGIWKYARARKLFNDPRWDNWLRTI